MKEEDGGRRWFVISHRRRGISGKIETLDTILGCDEGIKEEGSEIYAML